MAQFKYVFFNLSESLQMEMFGSDSISKTEFLKRLFTQKVTFDYRNSTYAHMPVRKYNPFVATDGTSDKEFIVGRLGKQTNADITELDDDEEEFITHRLQDWKASWFILCVSEQKQTAAIERLTNVNLKNLAECLKDELIEKAQADNQDWPNKYLVDVGFLPDLGRFWDFVNEHRNEISKVVFSFLRPNRQVDGNAGKFKELLKEWHTETPVLEHEVALKLDSKLQQGEESNMTNQFVNLVEDGGANVSLYNDYNRKIFDAKRNSRNEPMRTNTLEEDEVKRALTSENSLRNIIMSLFGPLNRDNPNQ